VAGLKGYEIIRQSNENMASFIAGNIIAFVVAMIAIKFFINYLRSTASGLLDFTGSLPGSFYSPLF
jgi:undecaprenyl pyrophosphate phosphatase UppP